MGYSVTYIWPTSMGKFIYYQTVIEWKQETMALMPLGSLSLMILILPREKRRQPMEWRKDNNRQKITTS